jgi:hypothetical protein
MTVNAGKRLFLAQVIGIAYETVANKPIHAGDIGEDSSAKRLVPAKSITWHDDASLGMLAAGADGLQL